MPRYIPNYEIPEFDPQFEVVVSWRDQSFRETNSLSFPPMKITRAVGVARAQSQQTDKFAVISDDRGNDIQIEV